MSIISSILKQAFSIIPKTAVQFRKFSARTVSDFGVSTMTYTAWANSIACVQPGIVSSFGGKCIELKDYKEMGLDWAKRYITVWMPNQNLEPPANRDGADQIKYNNMTFNVLQVENWDLYNGWQRCYAVEDKS